jgi:uncharacterized spore protein YtfJ
MKILDQVREVVGGTTVFGAPYEKNGVTVIPASRVIAGGGGGEDGGQGAGGGVGIDARPTGAFVVKGDDVSWVPAVDVTRIVIFGQIVGLVSILALRSIVRAFTRRR